MSTRIRSLHPIVLLATVVMNFATARAQSDAANADFGLRSGPMVGYAELTEAALWVQTTRPALVQFRYWIEGQPATSALSPVVQTTREGDGIAKVILAPLKSGNRYGYELYIDGQLVPRLYRLMFQTQAHWQWRTDPPAFTVAFGSCAYVNEPEFDRPGEPYGSQYEIFNAIAAKQPDVMLWLGDNVYYREPDFFSVAHMRHRNAHTRALPEMQALLGATHHYAIWDDHDYGPNDSDRTYRMRKETLEIFKSYWANPAYGSETVPGVFFRFEWADMEFFMLDDRYHRSPNSTPDSPEKVMFGPAQIGWLKDALSSSRAPFKIVVNGNQMLNPVTRWEEFSNFKHEQTDLLNWIKTNKIPGVLFLSGDKHLAELMRLDDPNFYPLYDFTSSPFTAGTYAPGADSINAARVPGTYVVGKKNFGLLRFEGPRRERKLTMECYDKTGKLLWKQEVKAAELRVK